jgi:hypothetical protein
MIVCGANIAVFLAPEPSLDRGIDDFNQCAQAATGDDNVGTPELELITLAALPSIDNAKGTR